MIGLAPTHSLIARQETVEKGQPARQQSLSLPTPVSHSPAPIPVVWSPAVLSASHTAPKGKRKRGSTQLQPHDPLCTITTSLPSACSYTVLAGVRGQLLEVNEVVMKWPELLMDRKSSQWEGFIAVVLMDRTQRHEIGGAVPLPVYKTSEEWQRARGRGGHDDPALASAAGIAEEKG